VRQVDTVVEAKAPWKGEEGITVQYDLGQPTLAENLRDRRREEVIYERVDFGDGGFKIDVLLSEKPDTNRFCYAIEGHEQYDFFYQPPLTAEEIAGGAYRPPEIEGSYAVYHKTLKNHEIGKENYATGKVLHIPRPQVWEIGNEDNKVWADLSYVDGELCVTAPQDFIDNADYTNGVRIDPTFGYTTAGASNLSYSATTAWANNSTAPEAGTITSISASVSASAVGSDLAVAVYADSSTNPTALLAQDTGNVAVGTSQAWVTANISQSITGGVTYHLAGWFNGGCGCSTRIYYDAGTKTISEKNSLSFETWADPFSRTNSFANFNLSIYATYDSAPVIPPNSTLYTNNGTIRINNGKLDI